MDFYANCVKDNKFHWISKKSGLVRETSKFPN